MCNYAGKLLAYKTLIRFHLVCTHTDNDDTLCRRRDACADMRNLHCTAELHFQPGFLRDSGDILTWSRIR